MAALGRIRLSPWLIALGAASLLLGDSLFLCMGLACVLLHELGHALAARCCGAAVEEIEIAPFGGVARIRGLEQLSSGKTVFVALAGPAVSAGLMMACGCAAYLWPEQAAWWARGMSANLSLVLFNLLPAYPMDGGRVLCALLRPIGAMRAQRVTAGIGIALGAVLMLLGALSLHYTGKVNVTLLICGGYVIFAAVRALRQTPFSYMQMLIGRERELGRRRALPVRTVAVRLGTTDAEVLSRMQPGALYRVVYVDEDMRVRQERWESELLYGGRVVTPQEQNEKEFNYF